MQMTEDAAMDGVQLLIVAILLGCLLIQMCGGHTVAVHLQEVLGADRAGTVELLISFLEYASSGNLIMCSLQIVHRLVCELILSEI
jgi:hypothetical protein